MTAQDLKNAILQLAVQGRLVEQCIEEGTTEEILKETNRKAVVYDGSMSIPKTWSWVKLTDITDILYGFPFNSDRFSNIRIGPPIIRIRDINKGKSNTYSDEVCDERYRIKHGDMLVGMDGNFQVAFWNSEDAWLNQRVCRITAKESILDQKYLFYYLPIVLKEINSSVSYSTVKHLSAKLLNTMTVPVPPAAEQKRIVSKIDELLPLVEEYGKAEEKLTQLNAGFPDKLRKSILQQAIQGKLTECDPSDEPASELLKRIRAEKEQLIKEGKIKKEKPLPPITEEEIPFETPNNWEWVRMSDVIDVRDGTHDTPKYVKTGYPLITGKDFYNGYFSLEKTQYISEDDYNEISKRSEVGIDDILFSMIGGNIGSMIRITEDNYFSMAIKNVALFKQYGKNRVLSQYLFVYLLSQVGNMKEKAKGGAQPFVPLNLLRKYLFPLPPLAEQQRIVDRVNELLALCDEMKTEVKNV